MECAILAGGLGTRLRSVAKECPKPMAKVHGRPFLEYLMDYWVTQGVNHFILSVGYLHEQIIDYFGNTFQNIPIDYAIEREPLGTGGGLLQAVTHLNTQTPFLFLNGDTFFEVPLKELSSFHKKGTSTLSLAHVQDNSRYDGVRCDSSGLITSLCAKETVINGGVSLIDPSLLPNFPEKCSFEKEILPSLITQEKCFGLPIQGAFIDIGIPEDYAASQTLFEKAAP